MSRIGNSPVSFSEETTVSVTDGIVTVKGKLGKLSQKVAEATEFGCNSKRFVMTTISYPNRHRSSNVFRNTF